MVWLFIVVSYSFSLVFKLLLVEIIKRVLSFQELSVNVERKKCMYWVLCYNNMPWIIVEQSKDFNTIIGSHFKSDGNVAIGSGYMDTKQN